MDSCLVEVNGGAGGCFGCLCAIFLCVLGGEFISVFNKGGVVMLGGAVGRAVLRSGGFGNSGELYYR